MWALALEIDLIDPDTHRVVCRYGQDIKFHLIHDRSLMFDICKGLPKDGYIVHLVDVVRHSNNLIFDETLEIGDADFLFVTRRDHRSEDWNFALHHGNIFQDMGSCHNSFSEDRWTEFGLLILFDFNTVHNHHGECDDEDCDGRANDYDRNHYRGHGGCNDDHYHIDDHSRGY